MRNNIVDCPGTKMFWSVSKVRLLLQGQADGHTPLDMGIPNIRQCEINNPYEHAHEHGTHVHNYTDLDRVRADISLQLQYKRPQKILCYFGTISVLGIKTMCAPANSQHSKFCT